MEYRLWEARTRQNNWLRPLGDLKHTWPFNDARYVEQVLIRAGDTNALERLCLELDDLLHKFAEDGWAECLHRNRRKLSSARHRARRRRNLPWLLYAELAAVADVLAGVGSEREVVEVELRAARHQTSELKLRASCRSRRLPSLTIFRRRTNKMLATFFRSAARSLPQRAHGVRVHQLPRAAFIRFNQSTALADGQSTLNETEAPEHPTEVSHSESQQWKPRKEQRDGQERRQRAPNAVFLANLPYAADERIIKNELWGFPGIENASLRISVSHTFLFAAFFTEGCNSA